MNNLFGFSLSTFMAFFAIVFLSGCKPDPTCGGCIPPVNLTKDLTYVKVNILSFSPISDMAFSDTIKKVAETFLENENHGVVPLMTLKTMKPSAELVLTQEIKRGMTVLGDISNPKMVKRHIKKEMLPKVALPVDFSQPFSLDDDKIMEYENKLKSPNGVTYIKFSSDLEDSTAVAHNADELVQKISELVASGKKEMTILYNIRFIKPDPARNLAELILKNEKANGIIDAVAKKRELDLVNARIGEFINSDNNNPELWYVRAINRAYAKTWTEAVEYLENAARKSIEKDSAFVIDTKIKDDLGTKLSFLKRTQSSKLKAIQNALSKKDVDLIRIYMGELQRIGKTDEFNLFLNVGNDSYNNTVKHYQIGVLNKDGNGAVTLNMTIQDTDTHGNKIDRTITNLECPYSVAKPIVYDNASHILTITNESPNDKGYVKLRLSNRKLKGKQDDGFGE